jgi:tRNA dimethylallyltransferase
MKDLIAIVGPTGIGKSRLAIRLAKLFNGEIISADSRQVYRYMDIGTDKPNAEALSLVKHHLINIINPDGGFGLSEYNAIATRAIDGCISKGNLPFLVGGSGQYVWSILEGWGVPEVPPDTGLRHNLEMEAQRDRGEGLYKELSDTDPVAAESIGHSNIRRIIRAIEVTRGTGQKFSRLKDKKKPPYNIGIIGLTADREKLYRRIDNRVDKMIELGLITEVEKLLEMGYQQDLPALSGIGYKQIIAYLNGQVSKEAAIQQIKYESHRFVRHQYNWFKLNDKRINWFDTGGSIEAEIIRLIKNSTGSKQSRRCL